MAEVIKVVLGDSHSCPDVLVGFDNYNYRPGTMIKCSCGTLYELRTCKVVRCTTDKALHWVGGL